MSHITVIGGTGYAGSAIVAEAASRDHQVTSFSRSLPPTQLPNVTYVGGDVSDEAALIAVIQNADVVVGALSPRGALAGSFRDAYRTIARLADTAKAPLFIVSGFSSLRPAPDAPRYVADLSHIPEESHAELSTVAALVTDDLPATSPTLDWVAISPAQKFGSWVSGERLGHYRVGDEVALHPEDGGEISGVDYALGFVDLIEQGNHHRTHLNLGY
jgi:putative NADH-flavin reductase